MFSMFFDIFQRQMGLEDLLNEQEWYSKGKGLALVDKC